MAQKRVYGEWMKSKTPKLPRHVRRRYGNSDDDQDDESDQQVNFSTFTFCFPFAFRLTLTNVVIVFYKLIIQEDHAVNQAFQEAVNQNTDCDNGFADNLLNTGQQVLLFYFFFIVN